MRWKSVLGCLLPLAVGGGVYAVIGDASLPILRLEFAGDAATAREVTEGRVADFRAAVVADFVFIVGYTATILAACWLRFRRSPGTRRWPLVVGGVAGIGVALFDVVENLALLRGLDQMSDGPFALAWTAAAVKFALLIPAAWVAVAALISLGREKEPAVSGFAE